MTTPKLASWISGLAALTLLTQPVSSQDPQAPPERLDSALWAGMKARSIGPAGMSGRVAALCVDPTDPHTIYAGAATGGLWRTRDQGITWTPLFDDQPIASIGAVAVHPLRPDQIWVGTGEGNPRNSASVGDGLFRSMDGGETWTFMGLEGTERIHRVILHPQDPDTAWVAAMGPSWGESSARGVYRTTDGGQSWTKVLTGDNESTGCADLVIDPRNPDKLVAAMWDHRRWPWSFRSGGEGSGLFVTHDGGDSWQRRTSEDGLPTGELGRIGLAISKSNPDVVYALVEAKKSALCRSNDGGKTFSKVNTDTNVNPRPFYFCDIRVDPQDEDTIYRLQTVIDVSVDGGKSFSTLVPWQGAHPDHHAMWIDPSDPSHMWIGNDGGVYRSTDKGVTWDFCENLPLAQFYHIRVDMDRPYHVYGGLQDNGSWRGPAYLFENGGIRNLHWQEIAFGDGFDASPDPRDSMQGYAMSQGGFLVRWNQRTGERRSIRPDAPADGTKLRFNWDAAFAQDPNDAATIYYGSQFLHRSTDRGETWEIVSDDLTTNDPERQKQGESGGLTLDVTGAENYESITAIAVHPANSDVVWAGTDDGRVHVTKDACATWSSVEANFPELPEGAWCQQLSCHPLDPDIAYAVFDNHRQNDWRVYVYRTQDAGLNWTRIASGNGRSGDTRAGDIRGYALSLAVHPLDDQILFLGTEFGLYVTLDGGAAWHQFTHGLPTVAMRDLAIHPRELDLVIGTHGRAAYVIDDLRPFLELKDAAAKGLHVFPVPSAEIVRVRQTPASRFPGNTEFRGDNRPSGARISFWVDHDELPAPSDDLGSDADDRVLVEILRDPDVDTLVMQVGAEQREIKILGQKPVDTTPIAQFEVQAHRGLNRITWDLRTGFSRSPGDDPLKSTSRPNAYEVLPGDYLVRIRFKEQTSEAALRVTSDHRVTIAASATRERQDTLASLTQMQNAMADLIDDLGEVRELLDPNDEEKGAAFLAERITEARKLDDISTVLLPNGDRVPALNGAKAVGRLLLGSRSWTTPLGFAEDENGERWYVHARYRWTTRYSEPVGLVVVEDIDHPHQNLLDRLDTLEKALWTKPGVKGIPSRDHALSALSEVRGAVSSTYDAPSASVKTRIAAAVARATDLLAQGRELIGSIREATGR